MYINCWLCGNLYCIQRQRSRRPSSSSGSETCEAHCDSCHHHPHLLVVTFSSQSIFLSSVCTKMRFNAYFLLRGNQRSPSELGNQLTKNSQIAPTFLQHLRLCLTQAILILILWQISKRPSSSSGSEALLAELANNSQPAGRELCRCSPPPPLTETDFGDIVKQVYVLKSCIFNRCATCGYFCQLEFFSFALLPWIVLLQSTTTTSRDRLPVCWKSTSS